MTSKIKCEIIPAILPIDFAELTDKLELVKGLSKMVQIDVCDGQFVPNATWPYRKQDDSFDKIVTEADGLPGWEALEYEMDLMVNHPEQIVESWVAAGATRIIIHAESKGDITEAVSILKDRVELGLALSVDTPIDVIEPHKDSIQFIQLMGISHIGFQGQPFDPKVLGKIREVKTQYPTLPVSIDGAVSLETAPQLIQAGATRLVIGSALFNSDNIVETMQRFKKLAHEVNPQG